MRGNIFSNVRKFFGGAVNILAAGTGDNTAVTGATVDRFLSVVHGNGDTANAVFESAKITVQANATLTATKSLSLAVEYQTSADGTTWNTAVAIRSASAFISTTGNAVYEFDLNLKSLPRYIRVNFTPDLSHSGTDVAVISSDILLGDCTANPVTRAVA